MLKLKRQTLQSRLKATEMPHSLKKVYSYLSVLPSLMALSMVSKKRVKDSYNFSFYRQNVPLTTLFHSLTYELVFTVTNAYNFLVSVKVWREIRDVY